MDNLTILKRYYEYANAGAWDAWCSLFADDMVMDEQLSGHIEGLATLRPLMDGMGTTYAKFQNVPRRMFVSGDEGAVVSHISARAARYPDEPIEADVMNYFRFKDGKIGYMANFHDSRPFAPFLRQLDEGRALRTTYPLVHDYLGKFMELPRDHVHAYVIELKDCLLVVDATLASSSAGELRKKAEELGKPIKAVLLTHGHPDHYTGLVKFADIPIYASQGCLDFAHREDIAKAQTAKAFLGNDYPPERVFPNRVVKDGDRLTFGGVTFTFSDLGPAESDSDGMWSYEVDGVTHAFVGDTVADHCHCFVRDGHTTEWLAVLDRLEKRFASNTRLYIGHGPAPASVGAIGWQREYLQTFREAVLALPEKEALAATRPTQEKVIRAVKRFLPGEATLFLLDYELEVSIPATWKALHGR